jgi:hypothetical protein
MVASMTSYPAPPWHTEGYAVFRAYRVPTSAIVLPEGLEARGTAGHSLGLLAFVRYVAPSPLEYGELIWMPTRVSAMGRAGFYVARMHVDSEASLAAGREVWALPKTLARFREEGDRVHVETEDGSRFTLRSRGYGPTLPARSSMATLQVRDGRPLRFKGSTQARVRLGSLEVEEHEVREPGWESFLAARPLPLPAVRLERFATTMHPPELP